MATAKRHLVTKHYVLVWLALLALTAISYVASRMNLGTLDTFIALAIAATKTTLVLLFFMHLIEQRFSNAMVPIVSFVFVLLLAALTAADVATRHTFPPAPIRFEADKAP
jgi:cytochrome c oxidase subunit 4